MAKKQDNGEETTTELPPSEGKLREKPYQRELARLHVELVKLQLWTVHKGLKACIVFEGRDSAGKGGVIKAITERVSPRVFRVYALPAPTAAGTTAPAWSASWASVARNRRSASSRWCRNSML